MSCKFIQPRSSPQLPIEICERIIDWIAAAPQEEYDSLFGIPFEDLNAWETLRACALTCRAWTPRARLHMQVPTVRIKCSPGADGDIDDFKSLLTRVPTLASFVRAVIAEPIVDRPSTFHTIPLVLPQLLSGLHLLQLTNGPFHPAPRTVPRMRRLTSLYILILQKVSFHSPNDLRRIINAFGELQRLEILDPSWRSSSLTDDTPSRVLHCPRSAIRLGTLQIGAQSAWLLDNRSVKFVEWLGASRILSSLENLFLERMMILDPKMLASVDIVLRNIVNSVLVLQLMFGPEVDITSGTWYTLSLLHNRV